MDGDEGGFGQLVLRCNIASHLDERGKRFVEIVIVRNMLGHMLVQTCSFG
jgi:hypothetical protein